VLPIVATAVLLLAHVLVPLLGVAVIVSVHGMVTCETVVVMAAGVTVTVTAFVTGVLSPQVLYDVQVIVPLAVPAVTVMLTVFCPEVIAQPLPVTDHL
jgi:hypothetical protein